MPIPINTITITSPNFPPTSRYHAVEVVVVDVNVNVNVNVPSPDGGSATEPRACLRRRFIPPAGRFALLHWVRIGADERLDRLSARELGDPLAFWRICDANDTNASLRPQELTEVVGRALRITLPEGIPATPNAAGN